MKNHDLDTAIVILLSSRRQYVSKALDLEFSTNQDSSKLLGIREDSTTEMQGATHEASGNCHDAVSRNSALVLWNQSPQKVPRVIYTARAGRLQDC